MDDLLVHVEPVVVGASVAGFAHLRAGMPCQDRFASAAREGVVVLAVADGMGSAPLSHEGADAAVRAAVGSDDAMEAVEQARAALEARADLLGCELRALACTLSVSVWRDGILSVAHIGDGAVVAETDGGLVLASAPAESEYVNETDPLTAVDWLDRVRLASVEQVRAVAAFTDGLTHATLEPGGSPSERFFGPLLRWARGPRADGSSLAALLGGAKVSEHSDDDKTLAIMVTLPPS